MSTFLEQHLFNAHLSEMDAIAEYHRSIQLHNGSFDWMTDPLQTDPDNDHLPPHENALYRMYGVYGSQPVRPADRFVHPSAMNTPNNWQNNTQFFGSSCLHHLVPPDTATQFGQPPATYCVPDSAETTATRVWEAVAFHAVPESYSSPKPILHLPGKRVDSSRFLARSMATRSRHAPYPICSDGTKRGSSSPSSYECHWSDGDGTCGAAVVGTKNAIGRHLQVAHAVCLKADKTDLFCLWDRCHKSMRRESMPRHILAVHMQDKVQCPTCGSKFARPDSLQRHQRTCLVTGGDASEA